MFPHGERQNFNPESTCRDYGERIKFRAIFIAHDHLRGIPLRRLTLILSVPLFIVPTLLRAQEGFEYEVYSTHIETRRSTTLELHTNFVQNGRTEVDEGRFPTNRAFRSSFEISHGLLPWLEGSVYFVAGAFQGQGAEYVGNRLRLTAVAPAKWNLPFDLGVSHEIGYARAGFAEHRWMYELSPILGKSVGRFSFLLNPALETGFGSTSGGDTEVELEPRAKVGYEFGDDAAVALEYYGALGPATKFEPAYEQHHQLFATVETELAHKWEIGAGIGRGLTRESDRTVFMTKIEYHFGGEQ